MRDIWDEIRRMHEEMDRLFDNFYEREDVPMIAGPKTGREGKGTAIANRSQLRSPVCHISETESSVLAAFELPGVDKGDIELNVTEDSISIKAQRKVEKESKSEEKGRYSYSSFSSQFFRSMPLPARVDPDSVVAVYKDGMLRVTMPKIGNGKKSKRIDVK